MVCEAVAAYFADEEERLLAKGYIQIAADSPETPPVSGGCWPDNWTE
jgi:hypothetical protein